MLKCCRPYHRTTAFWTTFQNVCMHIPYDSKICYCDYHGYWHYFGYYVNHPSLCLIQTKFLCLVRSLHFGTCNNLSFSHLKKLLHPLWQNVHSSVHENKFSGSKVQTDRQTDRQTICTCISFLPCANETQNLTCCWCWPHFIYKYWKCWVSVCQECDTALLGTWLPVLQDNIVVSPSRVERSLQYYTTLLLHNSGNQIPALQHHMQ